MDGQSSASDLVLSKSFWVLPRKALPNPTFHQCPITFKSDLVLSKYSLPIISWTFRTLITT